MHVVFHLYVEYITEVVSTFMENFHEKHEPLNLENIPWIVERNLSTTNTLLTITFFHG